MSCSLTPTQSKAILSFFLIFTCFGSKKSSATSNRLRRATGRARGHQQDDGHSDRGDEREGAAHGHFPFPFTRTEPRMNGWMRQKYV